MGTEAEEKSAQLTAKKRQLRFRATILATVGALILIYHETHEFMYEHFHNNGAAAADGLVPPDADTGAGAEGGYAMNHGTHLANGGVFDPTLAAIDPFAHLENCTVSFQSPAAKDPGEWTTKPLWFPAHPNTIEDPLHKQLITGITGLSAGGKSFYASSKGMKLKQCFGQTETATCANVHPIVDMGNKHPGTRADKFYDKYILGLRNPMTNIPAFNNGKAIKYHGLCQGCQVPEDEWRKFRDEWLKKSLEAWTNFIATWKKMKEYKVGTYVVYEHLFDPIKGPETVKRIASLLKDAGFSTAPDEDIPCIWYKAMGGKDILKSYHERPYEYKDYVPGYTVAQREVMFEKLNTLAEEQANDTELVAILREYQHDIRTRTRIDTEWTNGTTK